MDIKANSKIILAKEKENGGKLAKKLVYCTRLLAFLLGPE